MSNASKQDWTKPAAMAIPKGGFDPDHVEQGRYGPIFPKTPACYGFSIMAKIIPGREDVLSTSMPGTSRRRWPGSRTVSPCSSCTICAGCSSRSMAKPTFMYQGIFDTDFDKYTEDAVAIFSASGIDTVFENLEGFPNGLEDQSVGVRQVCPRASLPELP